MPTSISGTLEFSRHFRQISFLASTTPPTAALICPGAVTAAPAIEIHSFGGAPSSITSQDLQSLVSNPFQSLFTGPNAIFNEPESRYGNDQLPLFNLLGPTLNSTAPYQGLPSLGASSSYNALQVVFQKREGKYINLEGNYTWSKNMDDSSTGFNAFVGTLNNGNPQELDNLKAEWSVSANDATNRFVLAAVLQLPVGRGTLIGANMSRPLNALVGGWQLTTLATFQTGQPLPITMGNSRIADGNQRPNVTCPERAVT